MRVTVAVPERLRLNIPNAEAVLGRLASAQAGAVRSRLAGGSGVDGELPAPKDGGRPLVRTGALAASIGSEVRKDRRGNPFAVVRAYGARPSSENVSGKRASARERTRERRAAAVVGAVFRAVASDTVGGRPRLGRIRVRTADTNAALVGILSVPPKEIRGVNGGRASYRVMGANARDENAAAATARAMARVEAVAG